MTFIARAVAALGCGFLAGLTNLPITIDSPRFTLCLEIWLSRRLHLELDDADKPRAVEAK